MATIQPYCEIWQTMYCYLGYVHFILQVHALFSSCVWSGWRGQGPCGCGVAVRVENSLFVHRTCEEISYRYSRSLLKHEVVNHICDNRHMVVDIKDPWTTVNWGQNKSNDMILQIDIALTYLILKK